MLCPLCRAAHVSVLTPSARCLSDVFQAEERICWRAVLTSCWLTSLQISTALATASGLQQEVHKCNFIHEHHQLFICASIDHPSLLAKGFSKSLLHCAEVAEKDAQVLGATALLSLQGLYRACSRSSAVMVATAAALLGSAAHTTPQAVGAIASFFLTFSVGFIRPPLLNLVQVGYSVIPRMVYDTDSSFSCTSKSSSVRDHCARIQTVKEFSTERSIVSAHWLSECALGLDHCLEIPAC